MKISKMSKHMISHQINTSNQVWRASAIFASTLLLCLTACTSIEWNKNILEPPAYTPPPQVVKPPKQTASFIPNWFNKKTVTEEGFVSSTQSAQNAPSQVAPPQIAPAQNYSQYPQQYQYHQNPQQDYSYYYGAPQVAYSPQNYQQTAPQQMMYQQVAPQNPNPTSNQPAITPNPAGCVWDTLPVSPPPPPPLAARFSSENAPQLLEESRERFFRLVAYDTNSAAENSQNVQAIPADPSLAARGAQVVSMYQNRQQYPPQYPIAPPRHANDEYLVSGGDGNMPSRVQSDWSITNLQTEETIAHFDTVSGAVVVVPSNPTTIYAPRFQNVRQVQGVVQESQRTWVAANDAQTTLAARASREQIGKTAQETHSLYARNQNSLDGMGGSAAATANRGNISTAGDRNVESVMSYRQAMHLKSFSDAEEIYLASGGMKAAAWEGGESLRVSINNQEAIACADAKATTSLFALKEETKGNSLLRLIKVASADAAQPGDLVEFTVRFDNVGNRPIGNVTIVDNLTTRLEFLPGTAQSSLATGFLVEPNNAGSFTLRWEITEPLLPQQYGVVQFTCRVR